MLEYTITHSLTHSFFFFIKFGINGTSHDQTNIVLLVFIVTLSYF